MQGKNATGSRSGIEFDALSESASGINKNRKINEDYKYIDKDDSSTYPHGCILNLEVGQGKTTISLKRGK